MTNALLFFQLEATLNASKKEFHKFLGIPLYAIALSQNCFIKKFEKVILAVDKEEKIRKHYR